MRQVSAEYNEAIQLHRTKGIRHQMYTEISLGVFADGAKEGSTYTIPIGVPYSDANNMYTNTSEVTVSYATWEAQGFRLDGVQRFMKGNNPQGYTSQAVADGNGAFDTPQILNVVFDKVYDAVGLSFQFDSRMALPSVITVRTYGEDNSLLNTSIVTNIDTYDFKPELSLDDFKRMEIEFTAVLPYSRVRLNSILFGIGYTYIGDDLIGVTHKRIVHPLMLTIPVNELQFTLYNMDGRFSITSDNSVIRFLKQKQIVTLRYGYDLTGFGDIEWFKCGRFFLDSWDTKGYQTTFVCRDTIYFLTKTQYRYETPSAPNYNTYFYELSKKADIIANDAGVVVSESTALDWLYTYAALSERSHAECLQLISGHALCIMYTDDNGSVVFRRAYLNIPETHTTTTANAVPQLSWSDGDTLYQASNVDYATFEADFFRADGKMQFSDIENPIASGLVYNKFPDIYGGYSGASPFINYVFDSAFDVNQLTIFVSDSASNINLAVLIWDNNSQLIYNKNANSNSSSAIQIDGPFVGVTRIQVLVISNNKYQRARLMGFIASTGTGKTLRDTDVLGTTNESLAPKCKDVKARYYPSWANLSISKVFLETNIPTGVDIEIAFPKAHVLVTATVPSGYTLQSAMYYARFAKVHVTGPANDVKISFTGIDYYPDNNEMSDYIVPVSEEGEDAIIENPAFAITAAYPGSPTPRVARAAARYYQARNVFSIDTLGYPEIDAGDSIIFNNTSVVVLENIITSKGGAMRGKMKLRGGKPDGLADT